MRQRDLQSFTDDFEVGMVIAIARSSHHLNDPQSGPTTPLKGRDCHVSMAIPLLGMINLGVFLTLEELKVQVPFGSFPRKT